MSSRYESTRLDFRNSRVDRVILGMNLLVVVVEGVCKVSSSRFEWPRVDTTQVLGLDC